VVVRFVDLGGIIDCLHYTIIDRFTLYNYWPFYTIQLLTVLHFTIIDRFTLSIHKILLF